MRWTVRSIYAHILPRVLCWINQSFNSGESLPRGSFDLLLQSILVVEKSRGQLEALDYVKRLRTAFMAYLAGTPLKKGMGVRVTYDGIPWVLGASLIGLIRSGSPGAIRQTLTVLTATRALRLGKVPDISSISSPSKAEGFAGLLKYTESFWTDLGYTHNQSLPRSLYFRRWHLSTKSGPNGQALWTSFCDLLALPEDLISAITLIGGSRLTKYILVLQKIVGYLYPSLLAKKDSFRFRKLAYFPDKEAKVRVVGILDYFSQSALRPLHRYLYHALRKIRQDCTHSQGSFKDILGDAKEFWSFDLSAATDRFPIRFIQGVLWGRLPTWYIDAWHHIMVGYPFDLDGVPVRYAVGNPMGAYSSWASFAIAHHYLVYECCRDLKLNWKQLPYCLLGDDIVIANRAVAELYYQRLTQLGVDISVKKSHIASPTLYEFAKRIVYKGVEVTPFPVSALRETSKRSYLLAGLLMESIQKGWVPIEGTPAAVQDYYRLVNALPARLCSKFADVAYLTEHMIQIMRTNLPATDIVNICRRFKLVVPDFNEEQCLSILQSIVVKIFSKSYDGLHRGKPLGQLAVELVMKLTDVDIVPDADLGEMGVYAHPQLGAHALVEMSYTRLLQDARALVLSDELWPLTFRTIALPMDDSIYVLRTSKVIQRASCVIGKELLKAMGNQSFLNSFL